IAIGVAAIAVAGYLAAGAIQITASEAAIISAGGKVGDLADDFVKSPADDAIQNGSASSTVSKLTGKILNSTNSIDKGGLTRAGRALQKHGNRVGSVYPKPTGNESKLNGDGLEIVKKILNNPNATTRVVEGSNTTNRYGGPVTDIQSPGGMGIRIDQYGNFIGLLEPK
ncbi:MAG: hypothetical protein ACRCUP_07615, partial [Mycoplasmatales bacterium]